MPLIFMCFPAPYARSASHTQTAPSISSPHPSARLSPYAGAVLPYVFTASPHSHQASKIPTLVSARPAFPAPQIRHPPVSTNSLRRLLVRYHMSRRSTNPPRPALGYGIASRCDDGIGVAVGACTQARLEAGNCEEGFTCLFQGRPYSRIRPALAVPCFFAAGCPRRVCRDPQAGLPPGCSRTRATGSSGRAAQRGPRGQNRRTGPCGMRRGGRRGHGRQCGASDDRGQDPKTGTAHARRRLPACQRVPGVKGGKATQGDAKRARRPKIWATATPGREPNLLPSRL